MRARPPRARNACRTAPDERGHACPIGTYRARGTHTERRLWGARARDARRRSVRLRIDPKACELAVAQVNRHSMELSSVGGCQASSASACAALSSRRSDSVLTFDSEQPSSPASYTSDRPRATPPGSARLRSARSKASSHAWLRTVPADVVLTRPGPDRGPTCSLIAPPQLSRSKCSNTLAASELVVDARARPAAAAPDSVRPSEHRRRERRTRSCRPPRRGRVHRVQTPERPEEPRSLASEGNQWASARRGLASLKGRQRGPAERRRNLKSAGSVCRLGQGAGREAPRSSRLGVGGARIGCVRHRGTYGRKAASAASPSPAELSRDDRLPGLVQPTVVAFSPDGRVFVGERSGLVKVFDNLSDPTPSVFADLRTNVYNNADHGLVGLALDPSFPTKPYVYVLYSYDAAIGGLRRGVGFPGRRRTAARPRPRGACPAGGCRDCRRRATRWSGASRCSWRTGAISSVTPSGPSTFGSDGSLYAGGGDGGNVAYADWGQTGNVCGDPPGAVGENLSPPTAEGGALRCAGPSHRRPIRSASTGRSSG